MRARLFLLLAFAWNLHDVSFAAGPAEPPSYSADLLKMANEGDPVALANLQQLAEQGLPLAQYDLGQHHLQTIKNFDEDMPRVAFWMAKAAEQGVSKAQIPGPWAASGSTRME